MLLGFTHVFAQDILERNDSIVVIENGDTLDLAWASGLNAAHVSSMDINLDGKMDLFIFEPNTLTTFAKANKIYPFINEGGPNETKYRYAPEYRSDFPAIENFAICRAMVPLPK